MDVIYLCLFSLLAPHLFLHWVSCFFLTQMRKTHPKMLSLGNDITEIVLSLCNSSNWKRTQWNSEKKWYSNGCFCFFSFACALALEFHIHILLPLFAIHFTVAFGWFAIASIIQLYTITRINRSKSCVMQSYPNGNKSVHYFFFSLSFRGKFVCTKRNIFVQWNISQMH